MRPAAAALPVAVLCAGPTPHTAAQRLTPRKVQRGSLLGLAEGLREGPRADRREHETRWASRSNPPQQERDP